MWGCSTNKNSCRQCQITSLSWIPGQSLVQTPNVFLLRQIGGMSSSLPDDFVLPIAITLTLTPTDVTANIQKTSSIIIMTPMLWLEFK